MKWCLFILILLPCYALETIICSGINDSYDCAVYSPDEPLLEDVIHVTESEGMNTDISQEYDTPEPQKDYLYEDFTPLIFPQRRFW